MTTQRSLSLMPDVNYQSLILHIFSSQLPPSLINDLACYFIQKFTDAASVSILIYSGEKDKLLFKGGNLSKELAGIEEVNSGNGACYLEIFDNMAVYALIYHVKNNTSLNYRDALEEYKFYFSDLSDILSFKTIWSSYKKWADAFKEIHNAMFSEEIDIAPTTLTGNFYQQFLTSGYDQCKTELLDLHSKDYCNFRMSCIEAIENNLPVKIRRNRHYLAFPLMARDRVFGILRIIFSSKSNLEEVLDDALEKNIVLLRQIISMHLENLYYRRGLELTNAIFAKRVLTKSENLQHRLNDICTYLQKIINSKGAVITLREKGSNRSVVQGYSKSLNNYIQGLYDMQTSSLEIVSPGLSTAISDKFGDNPKIKALIINDLNKQSDFICYEHEDNSDTFSDDLSEPTFQLIDNVNDWDVKALKERRLVDLLETHGVTKFLIIRIPKEKNGFIVFVNSENRRFTKSDIEMVYSGIQRIGIELEIFRDYDLEKNDNWKYVLHQFLAPINVMQSTARQLLKKQSDSPRVKRVLEHIITTGTAAISNIDTLQMLLEIGTSNFRPLMKINTQFEAFLHANVMEYKDYLLGRKLNIRIEKPLGVSKSIVINMDSGLIKQVFSTLVNNAYKYSFKGSDYYTYHLSRFEGYQVRPGELHIFYEEKEDSVVIKFSSWGHEIDEAEREKIFDKYYRGNNVRKSIPVGFGIGLFLCKKIIQAHKGTIEVEPSQHKYLNVFKINLPKNM